MDEFLVYTIVCPKDSWGYNYNKTLKT